MEDSVADEEAEIEALVADNQLKAVSDRPKAWAHPEIAELILRFNPHSLTKIFDFDGFFGSSTWSLEGRHWGDEDIPG